MLRNIKHQAHCKELERIRERGREMREKKQAAWEERRRVIKVGEHMVRKLMMKVCHYSLYNQQMKCYKTMFRHIFENMSLSVLCCIDMYCSL